MGTGAVSDQVECAQWSSVVNQEVDEITASVQGIRFFLHTFELETDYDITLHESQPW